MGRKRRTPSFKKRVAIEALREEKTLSQIASEYEVHPTQVTEWKRVLISGAESLFARKSKSKKEGEASREDLERKVGQLTIENDYLKKKLGY